MKKSYEAQRAHYRREENMTEEEKAVSHLYYETNIFWKSGEVPSERYVREMLVQHRNSTGAIRLNDPKKVLGWSEVSPDVLRDDDGKCFRRVFFLMPHDPYESGGCPGEAVIPSSIQKGVPSRHPDDPATE